MPFRLYQVDAFTDKPFSGNPAAVCLLDAPKDAVWMQAVAREMNLSETAFLEPRADGFGLRWFTPTVEVALCGHATLASAHVLWETGRLAPSTPARFHTQSGLLTCHKAGAWIEMDFPAKTEQPVDPPPGLFEGLGVTASMVSYVGRNQFDYLVQLSRASTLRSLKPDHARLRAMPVRGVVVTALSDAPEFDFISRFFAPGSGIDEDPVTGSTHCLLGPFWKARLGKERLMAYQASARGGVMQVTPRGDRVILAGHAVTVLRGELA